MKSVAALSIVQLLAIAGTANAAIVCEGVTSFKSSLRLTIDQNQSLARVEVYGQDGGKELDQEFAKIDDSWDGHMTGLITAPGLSVKYENQYGCIRDAVITTNVRGGGIGFIDTVSVRACKGGSTPDDLCLRHGTDELIPKVSVFMLK